MLKDFVKGAIFAAFILPVISNNVAQFLETGTQYICTKINAKTFALQKQIEAAAEEGSQSTSAIGFQIRSPEEEEYEEDNS